MSQCSWCPEEAIGEIELEPAKRGRDKRTGVMVEKKPAKTAQVCLRHRTIIEDQPPFYKCGCSYVEGEFKCLRHQSILRSPWKEKLSNHTVKHSPVGNIVIKP